MEATLHVDRFETGGLRVSSQWHVIDVCDEMKVNVMLLMTRWTDSPNKYNSLLMMGTIIMKMITSSSIIFLSLSHVRVHNYWNEYYSARWACLPNLSIDFLFGNLLICHSHQVVSHHIVAISVMTVFKDCVTWSEIMFLSMFFFSSLSTV